MFCELEHQLSSVQASKRGAGLPDVDLQDSVRVVMSPVPVILTLTLTGAIPIHVRVMMLLPINAPGTIFVFVEIVIILVVLVVHVVAVIAVIVMVASVIPILRKQIS
jgi:hypothetical protein